MGKPMILYGLADLANPSFEDDTTPVGWDLAASVNGVHTIDSNFVQSPGDGIPSVRSLKQNVTGSTGSDVAIARQRIAIGDLPGFVTEELVEVAAVASLRVARGVADRNCVLRLKQYDSSGTAAPGSGASLTPPAERRFACGGPDWSLRVSPSKIHHDCAYIDIELVYDITLGSFDANAHAWWDRVMVGVLVDFTKGVRSFDMDVDAGYKANEGNGVAEIVSIAKPHTRIDVEIRNLIEGASGLPEQLEQFSRWLARPDAGFLAIWGDREYSTNARRHFAQCYHDPGFSVSYPPGFARRNYDFRFIAPSEAP